MGKEPLSTQTAQHKSGEWKNGNLIERDSSGKAIGCVEGNCDNGKGTGVWEKGFKYVGEWKMQNMHGFGIGTWPNGDRYEGDWVNGQRTGQGKYFYSGGGVYTGEWKNNNRHGEGTMIWNDGVKQVAIWEMDKPVKTISLSKNFIFKGGSEWKDGDIINKKDPSNFIKLSFVEKKKVMGYDKRTLSNKYTKDGWGKSSFTVFVFNASFENSKDILINVNDEFKTDKKAKKQAIKWAKIYGQMPNFLKKNVKEITIHKGNVGWAQPTLPLCIVISLTFFFKKFGICPYIFAHFIACFFAFLSVLNSSLTFINISLLFSKLALKTKTVKLLLPQPSFVYLFDKVLLS